MKKLLFRVIEWPAELTSALTALLVAGALWLENVIGMYLQIDVLGKFQELAVGAAVVFAFVAHKALERWIPVQFHEIANSVLKWVAALVAAAFAVKFFM